MTDELPGSDRAGVRSTITTISTQLANLSQRTTVEECRVVTDELRASWTQLVKLLALGPAPEYRACPHCKQLGMLAGTRCGFCWEKLSPLTQEPSAVPPPATSAAVAH